MRLGALPAHMQQRVVVTGTGCWQWTGAINRNGYGRIGLTVSWAAQRRWVAHRLAYLMLVGPIPEGLQLDHLCRNRACINPEHLEPVTAAENVRRSVRFSSANGYKTSCPRSHPYGEANTRITPRGFRACRTCHRDRMRYLRNVA